MTGQAFAAQGMGCWLDLKTHEQACLHPIMDTHGADKDEFAALLGISARCLYRKMQAQG